ncbi:PEP-CTERM sorting domain-containing protein [Geoalkalibacter sp.]|uniref:PEP-CTERM sorting domain-containing protein n=1 Tax=Geoalkalibacter sp. TaxID=3041440 RepID=UPI00272E1D6F|nr:PEP-CTERM sorting domain-containing protein [Geoalkalibacter sp.]
MKRIVQSFSLMLVLICTAPGAQAITLAELFNGGSITAGDKLFDNWQLLNHVASDGRELNAGNIEVTALDDGGLNPGPGLDFSVANNELSITGDGLYAFVDLMFGFRVSVLDPLRRITDNSLELTDGFYTWVEDVGIFNDVGFYIRETVGTSPWTSDLGIKEVEFSLLDGVSTAILDDLAAFPPRSEIWVTKNILVWAVAETDSAALFGFEQRFSQTVIPEPGTLVLLALGGVGLLIARRKSLI